MYIISEVEGYLKILLSYFRSILYYKSMLHIRYMTLKKSSIQTLK